MNFDRIVYNVLLRRNYKNFRIVFGAMKGYEKEEECECVAVLVDTDAMAIAVRAGWRYRPFSVIPRLIMEKTPMFGANDYCLVWCGMFVGLSVL